MIESKSIKSIFEITDWNGYTLREYLDNFLNVIIRHVNKSEELQEFLIHYNSIYQIIINDLNLEFWINVSHGKVDYEMGFNKDVECTFISSKKIMLKIIKGEISGLEAYMKGLIEYRGDLIHIFNIRNFLKFFLEYIKKAKI